MGSNSQFWSGVCLTAGPQANLSNKLIDVRIEKNSDISDIDGFILPEHDSPPLDCDSADFLFLGTYNGDISPPLSSQYIPGWSAACGNHHCKEKLDIYRPVGDMMHNCLKRKKNNLHIHEKKVTSLSLWFHRSSTDALREKNPTDIHSSSPVVVLPWLTYLPSEWHLNLTTWLISGV